MPDPTDLSAALPAQPPTDAAPPDAAPAGAAANSPVEAGAAPKADAVSSPAHGVSDDGADTAADDTASPGPDSAAPVPGTPALPQLSPGAALDLLRQHFPALFAGPARPLKLRIQQDIQARAPGVFSRGTLSAFFRRHTGSTGYLIALSKATQRFDLDGQPAGELSDEHKQAAIAELARRRQVTREREQQAQAAQRAQQRESQRAEMAQQAEQMQARQMRAALLRDFQRTTLTLANFCALKGMTPDALQPLLDQAKKEAAEAPPPSQRPFDDRRGPRRDPRGGDRNGPRGPRADRPPRQAGAPGAPAGPGPRGPRRNGPAGQS